MNCSEFDTTVVEIARRHPVDAGLARQAEAHAAGCLICRQRLDDERLVTEHLTALRAAMRDVRAPDALEAALVGAFRGRRAAAPVAAAPRDASSRWWLGAAAALVLVAVSVGVGRWLATTGTPTTASSAPTASEVAPPPTPHVPAVAPGVDVRTEAPPEVAVEPARPRPGRATGSGRAAIAALEDGGDERVTYTSLPAALPRWSDEPLVPVRLRLPYAALPALGVQITREQWGETVPVEVLVGEDGIARGIRLVNHEVMDR